MSLLILLPTGNTADNNKLTLPPDFVTMDTEGGSLRQHDGETKGGFIHQATFPPSPFQGEVPVSELISGNALASLVGLTAGTAYNNNEPWLHFVDPVDNKTKYIAKKPYRHSISWDQLNAAGIVYGKQISIGSNQYICRLIKSGLTDPMDATAGYDTEPTHGSEWNRLMYPICALTGEAAYDVFNPDGPQPNTWASYDQTNDLYLLTHDGRYSWCQETHSGNTNQRVRRGYYGVCRVNLFASSSATSNYGWRPCLELVD